MSIPWLTSLSPPSPSQSSRIAPLLEQIAGLSPQGCQYHGLSTVSPLTKCMNLGKLHILLISLLIKCG